MTPGIFDGPFWTPELIARAKTEAAAAPPLSDEAKARLRAIFAPQGGCTPTQPPPPRPPSTPSRPPRNPRRPDPTMPALQPTGAIT